MTNLVNHQNLTGSLDQIYGDARHAYGEVSVYLVGDISNLKGDVTRVIGVVTDLSGHVEDYIRAGLLGRIEELALVYAHTSGTSISIRPERIERPLHDTVKTMKGSSNSISEVLHFTVRMGNPQLLIGLINEGANVNEQNSFGISPLHIAALVGDMEIISILLNNGANPLIKDKAGRTPHDLTMNARVRQLLKEASVWKPDLRYTQNYFDRPVRLGTSVPVYLKHKSLVRLDSPTKKC